MINDKPDLPLSPRARQTVSLAQCLAKEKGYTYVDSAFLIYAMAKIGVGSGLDLLAELMGCDAKSVAKQILDHFDNHPASPTPSQEVVPISEILTALKDKLEALPIRSPEGGSIEAEIVRVKMRLLESEELLRKDPDNASTLASIIADKNLIATLEHSLGKPGDMGN